MLVVLVLMAGVAAVLATRGPPRSQGLQTRAAAGSLAGALRAARARAMERAETVTVTIDPGRHMYSVAGDAPVQLSPRLSVTVLPPALKGPGETRLVRFSPDGSATGGAILLGDAGRQLRVDIEWLSGSVKVSDAG